MVNSKTEIMTYEEAISLYKYDEGKLFFKKRTSSRTPEGSEAGFIRLDGYRSIGFKRRIYATHRVIFMMHYGFFPLMVDHIDGDKLNNKIENLRAVTALENARNSKKQKNNSSGFKGVYFDNQIKKFRSSITVLNKTIHLGNFNNIKDAANAYSIASKKYHGEYGRVN